MKYICKKSSNQEMFAISLSSELSPVYTTVILGTARLNFGTRTHFFGHGTPNSCRVNAKLRVRGPKILSGPRPPQEVVSARLKMGPWTKNLLRTGFFSHIAKILCLYTNKISRENVVRRSHIEELRYILWSCI
jgi:hypothetical protein